MKLVCILEGVSCSHRLPDTAVNNVTCDSRQIGPGDVFVCVKGTRADGHDHAALALERGAAAVVCQRDLGLEEQIMTDDTRAAYALMCANLCGNPQKDLKLVGVTGTSGKTTITCLIRDILRSWGKQAGLIGTIQGEIGDMVIPARHTTPDPAQLYPMLARMKAAGMEYVVMEVSSHALDQRRVEGLYFHTAVFTNLSHEHLDYHGDMESYYLAKRRLFEMAQRAIVHVDDAYGRRLADELDALHKPVTTVSIEDNAADFTAHSMAFSPEGSRFIVVHGTHLMRIGMGMPGRYSVANALCALACAVGLGVPTEEIERGLSESGGVPGRMEIIEAGLPFTVIRDYAHTPEEIENVLAAVKSYAPGRIVTLFGCPGERDRAKRPEMARAAVKGSSQVILTSDNPRAEDPLQIIRDTQPGFEGSHTPVEIIVDRYDAIRWAIEHCGQNDILLLLGKGHEDYQVLGYGTIFFDERFIVQDIVGKLNNMDCIGTDSDKSDKKPRKSKTKKSGDEASL